MPAILKGGMWIIELDFQMVVQGIFEGFSLGW